MNAYLKKNTATRRKQCMLFTRFSIVKKKNAYVSNLTNLCIKFDSELLSGGELAHSPSL